MFVCVCVCVCVSEQEKSIVTDRVVAIFFLSTEVPTPEGALWLYENLIFFSSIEVTQLTIL